MNISVVDASNYFRAMLLLGRMDGKVDQSEAELMRRVGRILGFEKTFCENAVEEILENQFIVDAPPLFSTKDLALRFLKDGFSLAFVDGRLDLLEEEWIRKVATRNGIEPIVFEAERERARTAVAPPGRLAIRELLSIGGGHDVM